VRIAHAPQRPLRHFDAGRRGAKACSPETGHRQEDEPRGVGQPDRAASTAVAPS
jgi:hypothetical protein